MTLAEVNPLGELEDGSFVALDAHMEMENEARGRHKDLLDALGVGDGETRLAREPTAFELAGEAVDALSHRGVAGNVTEFDGDLGLVIGAGGGSLTLFDAVRAHGGRPANYCEIGGNPSVEKACGLAKLVLRKPGVEQDRGDDVDRVEHAGGHRRARRDQGVPGVGVWTRRRRSRSSGSRGRGRTRATRSSSATASSTPTGRSRCTRRRAARCEKIGGGRLMSVLDRRGHDVHRAGHHRPRGRQPDPRVPRLRARRPDRRRRHAGPPRPRGARGGGVRHRRAGRRRTTGPGRRQRRDGAAGVLQGRRVRGDRVRREADRDRHRAHPAPRRRADGRARRRCAGPGSSARTAWGSSSPTS